MSSTYFINDASGNYIFSQPPQAVRKEDGFLGSSLVTSLLSGFCPSSLYHFLYTVCSPLLMHKEKAKERMRGKQTTPLQENIPGNVYCISFNIFQRKERCLSSETTDATCLRSKLPVLCSRVQAPCV